MADLELRFKIPTLGNFTSKVSDELRKVLRKPATLSSHELSELNKTLFSHEIENWKLLMVYRTRIEIQNSDFREFYFNGVRRAEKSIEETSHA